MPASAPAVSRNGVFGGLCLVGGSDELSTPVCAGAVMTPRIDSYFSGCKERVLARSRLDGVATAVVHHRKPGVDQDEWLITCIRLIMPRTKGLQPLDRYLPPLLVQPWREQHHPKADDTQLQFELGGTA